MAELRTPGDIAKRHTVTFLRAHTPRGGRLLEVGCGAGQVALGLLDEGYDVTGIDADESVLSHARTLGVRTVHAVWPEFSGGPFDAIAFTRSLHHMNPLDAAVRRARELLRPGGVLLVEDFAFDETDAATIAWFVETLRSSAAREVVRPVPGEFVPRLLGAGANAKAAWKHQHDHELHPWPRMVTAVGEYFDVRELPPVPYLFRYLIPVVEESARGMAYVLRLRQQEMELADAKKIMLIGRRLVGMRKEGVAACEER